MEIYQGGALPCDRPRSTWSARAPFLKSNLLVVGLWFGWPLWRASRVSDQYLSVVVHDFEDMPFMKTWSATLPSSLLSLYFLPTSSVSMSPALPCSLSFTPSNSPNRQVSAVLSWISFWDRCQLQTKDIKSNKSKTFDISYRSIRVSEVALNVSTWWLCAIFTCIKTDYRNHDCW